MPILSKKAIISQAKELITKAEIKQAFEILLAHYYFKTQLEVNQLSARWHTYAKKDIKGILHSESVEYNEITNNLLTYLSSIETTTHNHFASNISRPADNILDAQNIPIGRVKDIEKLHEKLAQDNKIVCLRGIGGIGKTTIARGYCFTKMAADCFDSAYWINLDDNVNTQKPVQLALEQALILQLMQPLELQGKTVMEQRDIIAAYFADNQNHKLLILDNANDKVDIEKNLAWLKSFKCAILLTSRATIQNIADIPIETLSEDDALQVFSCFYNSPFREKEARILLQTLQYHTLLIELCAKTLQNDADITISQLITAAQDNKLDILNTENIILRNDLYIAEPIKNFLLAIFAISELSAAERQVLMYFSLLLNKEYALETLKTWFIFPADFENSPKLSQILKKLYQKGWLHENVVLKEEATLHFYACHPLIRYAVFEQMQPSTDSVFAFLYAIHKDTGYDAYKNPIEQAEYIEELKNIISIFQAENLIIAYIYKSLLHLYLNIGNYDIALKYGEKHLSIIENINPKDKKIIANTYHNIAVMYHYLNNYEKALTYHLETIIIRERILDENHIDLAISYNQIARTYEMLFNFEKALDYHLKAITIGEKILPENHPDLASSYNNIAVTYNKLGDYEKDLAYNLKAITICEKVLPKNHPNLAISYCGIAATYYYLSDYATAKDYIDKAMDIFKKVLPENHPDLKNSLSWQKTIYKALSKNT